MQMTQARLEYMFTGYCAVSGSPVNPHDYNRYRLTLPLVSGGGKRRTGYMHYCCWPCVCDTQDFIRVDTKTVSTSDGERQYHFAVLGNPCQNPDDLDRPFLQPFDRRWTSIRQSAPEVRCGDNHTLIGATLSDHGYPIIAMFFDAEQLEDEVADGAVSNGNAAPTPGRISVSPSGVKYQDETEWGPMCTDRANNGYNSGMGEIFRKVAAITEIDIPTAPAIESNLAPPNTEGTCEAGEM
jgi:hypothetical protein